MGKKFQMSNMAGATHSMGVRRKHLNTIEAQRNQLEDVLILNNRRIQRIFDPVQIQTTQNNLILPFGGNGTDLREILRFRQRENTTEVIMYELERQVINMRIIEEIISILVDIHQATNTQRLII